MATKPVRVIRREYREGLSIESQSTLTSEGLQDMTKIVLDPKGIGRREIELELTPIPDLRQIAASLPLAQQNQILEVWRLCHGLRNHIIQENKGIYVSLREHYP
jgi:hypothetical protein